MSKAPVSACLIVRDDPLLERAVASIRPYVAEICIACNSPVGSERNWAGSLADKYSEALWSNNERQEIADFSAARKASFDRATQPWILWLDSDDEFAGGERLADIIKDLEWRASPRALFPYEYLHDPDTGECICRHWRERIVRNDSRYHWTRPVHETLVAKDGKNDDVRFDSVRWIHKRTKRGHASRNLRILREYAKTHGDDPWTMFNLGKDLMFDGQYKEALEQLARYVDASGWDEERTMACLKLVDCEIALNPMSPSGGIYWAKRAQDLRPGWFEPRFALMKILTLQGMMGGNEDALRDLLAVGRHAVALGPTDTVQAIDPVDQSYRVHELMRAAAEVLHDWDAALEATERALVARPKDAGLALARKRYSTARNLARMLPDPDWPEKPQQTLAELAAKELTWCAKHALPLDVVFVCGPSLDPFNPEILAKRGVGGSETAVIEMAKRLAARGCKVRVYCYCEREGTWDGVDYLDVHAGPPGGSCDVLISWRGARLLLWMEAKVRLVWAHDVTVAGMTWPQAIRADRILAVSEWHRQNLIKAHGLHPSHVVATRNGIDPERFTVSVERDPHRIIYSSSPDRGLAVLLDMWPAIREEVPDASLLVAYGFEGWARVANEREDEHQRYLVKNLQERMRLMPGVVYRGRITQAELAREMLGAGIWTLPGWFPETSCCGAIESRAAGCRIVASKRAALIESVGEYGSLIEGDWLSDEYQDEFVHAVVSAMVEYDGPSREEVARVAREKCSWDGIADEWCKMFDELLREAATGALPEYQAVA